MKKFFGRVGLFFSCLFFLGFSQAHAADIIGKWTNTIKNDEFAFSEIEIITEFHENGIYERLSKGTFISGDRKAEYNIIEKSKWYIEDGYLYSEIVDTHVDNLTGDPSLIEIIKLYYKEGFKTGSLTRNKIMELNDEKLILLIQYEDGENDKAVLTKLN